MRRRQYSELPTEEQVMAELRRERERSRLTRSVRSGIYVFLIAVAAAVLIATMVLPVFRIYGSSMSPVLNEGDIVISVKTSSFQRGDIISFYYNNKVLVKRVIALPGVRVDIDDAGNIYVVGTLLDVPYLHEKALGECDIDMP